MGWMQQIAGLIDFRAILTLVLIFVPLELLFPHKRAQGPFRKHWLNDVVFLLLNGIVIKLGFLLIISAAMVGIGLVVPPAIGLAVRQQPIWLQAIEAVIVADIGFYLAHRTFHRVPFLWKFHVIHHSIAELDWLAAHRVHPVDQILTAASSYIPLFILGFSVEAIAVQVFLYQWQSHLIHSNVRLPFGPLKWVFASPLYHHWHHANDAAAYDRNFSAQLTFMDVLGGTLRLPAEMPDRLGLDEALPDAYHLQLAHPFRRTRSPAAVL